MKRNLLIFIVASLMLLSSVTAYSEDSKFGGDIRLTGKMADVNGNKAKFNEYSDIKDGAYGKINLKYDAEKYFLKFKASDIGYDTQSYAIDGGMRGQFRYHLKYNEIPHNITYGAKTFYSGVGTDNLTYSGTTAPFTAAASSYNTTSVLNQYTTIFDYSTKRKQYGGSIGLDMFKPLYFDVGLTREDKSGIVPVSGPRGTGSGNGMVELPAPVDYVTDTFKAELGYSKNPVFAALYYMYSKFDNDNSNLYFGYPRTAAGGATDRDVYSLPPNNSYYKLAFKGKVKLPLNSSINVNAGKSSAKSEANILDYYLAGTTTPTRTNITNITDTTFNGKVNTSNVGIFLTTSPVSFLDGKVYYKYYDKRNRSDQITGRVAGTNYTNPLFEYTKNSLGAELSFKLPAKFTVTPSYRYAKVDRERDDIPRTEDNVYALDVKWSGLDFMAVKAGYEQLDRDASWVLANNGVAFDGSPQSRTTYKIGVDLYPLDGLNVGLEYKNKKIDYENTGRGFFDEKGDEYGINADYAIGKLMTVAGYYDVESRKTTQLQNGTGAAVRWEVKQKDRTDDYGISADVYIIPKKLTLKAQYDNVHSDGFTDINYITAIPAGYTQDTLDLSNWDDYRKRSIMFKAIYNVTKSFSVAAGYAYEQFKYSDAAIDGYAYYYSSANTNPNYFTGAYSAPSYKANIIFCSLMYKF